MSQFEGFEAKIVRFDQAQKKIFFKLNGFVISLSYQEIKNLSEITNKGISEYEGEMAVYKEGTLKLRKIE